MIERFETGKTYFIGHWQTGLDGRVFSCDLFKVVGRKKLTKDNSYVTGMGFEANLYIEIFNSALIDISCIPNTDFSSKASELKELMDPDLSYEVKLDEAGIRRFMIQKLFELPYQKLYHFNGKFMGGK